MKTFVFVNPKRIDDRVAVEAETIESAQDELWSMVCTTGFKLFSIHKVPLKIFKFHS